MSTRGSLIASVYPVELADAEVLVGIADRAGVSAYGLANIINFETGGTWSPSVESGGTTSKGTHAYGLIQLLPHRLAYIGLTQAQLLAMTVSEQLEKAVLPWLEYVASKTEPTRKWNDWDVYVAVYDWPSVGLQLSNAFAQKAAASAWSTIGAYVSEVNAYSKLDYSQGAGGSNRFAKLLLPALGIAAAVALMEA